MLTAQSLTSSLSDEVRNTIIKGYESSVVTDIVIEEQMVKATFLHMGIYKVAIFSPHGVWQRTIYQATLPELTAEAKEVLVDKSYDNYDISQIEVVEQPQIKMYQVQMVNYIDSRPITVTVTDSGIVL